MAAPARYASVDALRGLTVAAMLLVNNPGDWGHAYAPLLHAQWHGCTPTDLVFPFFLFVAGVSISLGIVARAEAGTDASLLQRGVVARALRIIALGLLLHLLAMWLLDRPVFRIWGVLQRIGVCFLFAATMALHLRPRLQWLAIAVILIGYWALLAAGGTLAPGANIANRIDTALFAPYLYRYDPATGLGQDPEGLVSTLPAIATTLLGVRAGDWLRHGNTHAMAIAAVAMTGLGWAWSGLLPLNKPLWTSSYVLWTAGWALLALLVMHVLIDQPRLARHRPPLRHQRHRGLRRRRGAGVRAARHRRLALAVPARIREMDDADLRPLRPLARVRPGLRGAVVAGGLRHGPAGVAREDLRPHTGCCSLRPLCVPSGSPRSSPS